MDSLDLLSHLVIFDNEGSLHEAMSATIASEYQPHLGIYEVLWLQVVGGSLAVRYVAEPRLI